MVRGLITLSRWKEHVIFVFPLTLLGYLLATQKSGYSLDFRLAAIVTANILTVTYAFMINDIEDADDDLLMGSKALRNPVSYGILSKKVSYIASFIVFLTAFAFFYYIGGTVFWIGSGALALSHFYSSRPLRLKSWPIVDIISHALMLAGLLVLTSYFTFSSSLGIVWYVVTACILISSYGQIYNQLRDFQADKKAGLKNTTILLGQEYSRYLAYLVLFLGFTFLVISIYKRLFPFWLIGILLAALILSKRFRKNSDVTGVEAIDITGKYQLEAHIIMNTVILSWFVVSIWEKIL